MGMRKTRKMLGKELSCVICGWKLTAGSRTVQLFGMEGEVGEGVVD